MTTTVRALAGAAAGPAPELLTTVGEQLARWAATRPDAVAHTFLDHLCGPEVVVRELTWAEYDVWTRALGAVITQVAAPGDRVAILAPSGPEYVVAFAACLRSGVVAVPLFPPDMIGHGDRLDVVLADCTPSVVVTTTDKHDQVRELLAGRDLPAPAIVCADDYAGPVGESLADTFAEHRPALDELAYLQYTSGSTRAPAGVELTHGNLAANSAQIMAGGSYGLHAVTPVSWLPLFHDMGLLLGCAGGLLAGCRTVLMDPLAFVLQPSRWLRALGEYPDTVTAAPNFAYDLAARRVGPADLDGADLTQVRTMLNGAEPVQAATVERFVRTFAPLGLAPEAHTPCYGLAEAVVAVTMSRSGEAPVVVTADVRSLQEGRLEPGTGDGTLRLVASGVPLLQRVAIVDPQTRLVLGTGEIGEIWVHGPNVGRGYWGGPESSPAAFGGVLAEPGDAPAGPWLRTGDLGAFLDGRLFVTGRIKDVIIVDGRNLYPQDVEVAVAGSHEAIALNRLAAFSVPLPGGEAVVVVAERYRKAPDAAQHLDEIARTAKAAASSRQGVALHDFVLVEPDSVPRTSSGKIARQATRTAYLTGTLRPIVPTSLES